MNKKQQIILKHRGDIVNMKESKEKRVRELEKEWAREIDAVKEPDIVNRFNNNVNKIYQSITDKYRELIKAVINEED